jgi:hypothetical protein
MPLEPFNVGRPIFGAWVVGDMGLFVAETKSGVRRKLLYYGWVLGWTTKPSGYPRKPQIELEFHVAPFLKNSEFAWKFQKKFVQEILIQTIMAVCKK